MITEKITIKTVPQTGKEEVDCWKLAQKFSSIFMVQELGSRVSSNTCSQQTTLLL